MEYSLETLRTSLSVSVAGSEFHFRLIVTQPDARSSLPSHSLYFSDILVHIVMHFKSLHLPGTKFTF